MDLLNKNIINIEQRHLSDIVKLIFGSLLCAIAFNIFFLPNDIVVGFSGLAIVANKLWDIEPSLFLIIGCCILLIISQITLGFETTKKSAFGSLLYPFLVEIINPIRVDLTTLDPFVMMLLGSMITGFGSGLIFKIGYSTGGTDIINQIISKIIKRPIGTSMVISNTIIISLALIAIGPNEMVYSIVCAFIMGIVIDKVMIGISESKTFNIITNKELEVKKLLLSGLSHGVTITNAIGGYTGNEVKIIMCVVPTKEYILVKESILEIDENAVILVSDVYEAVGNK